MTESWEGKHRSPRKAKTKGRAGTPGQVASLSLEDRGDAKTFGKGALLWLIGIPLPIILLLALFWR
jgi:hypothetical protein